MVDDKVTGTSLTAEPSSTATQAGRYQPNAPVVTQLFAMRLDLPQTRARRRASTEEGVAAYGATGVTLRLGRRALGMSWPA